jgi:hypothetical protein
VSCGYVVWYFLAVFGAELLNCCLFQTGRIERYNARMLVYSGLNLFQALLNHLYPFFYLFQT